MTYDVELQWSIDALGVSIANLLWQSFVDPQPLPPAGGQVEPDQEIPF